jgi:hypothetical protein
VYDIQQSKTMVIVIVSKIHVLGRKNMHKMTYTNLFAGLVDVCKETETLVGRDGSGQRRGIRDLHERREADEERE